MSLTLQESDKRASENEHNNLLEIANLKKHFPIKDGVLQRNVGYTKAVDGLSLKVKRGETVGIVGESGCGKSTAGRTIIRLYEPTGGKIIYKGNDITAIPERKLRKIIRKDIQMIFRSEERRVGKECSTIPGPHQ